MVAGCPRTVSPPPDECEKLGQELIKWIEDSDDALHLSQWYSKVKKMTFKQWDTLCQRKEFIPYYEEALQTIGLKYLTKDSSVEPGIKQRWIRLYFRDLAKMEDEKAAYLASLKDDKGEQALSLSDIKKMLREDAGK